MSECEACLHAEEFGWWGPSVLSGWTHNRDVHVNVRASWGSCSACHNIFKSVGAFDKHQDKRGRGASFCAWLQSVGLDTNTPKESAYGLLEGVRRDDGTLFGPPSWNFQRLYDEGGCGWCFGTQKLEE